MNLKELCQQLESEIEQSYEEGVTPEKAEKLAGKFLKAQMQVSAELTKADLSSRMRKSGVKAVRAAVYLDIVSKAESKKPTETHIASTIDTNDLVGTEQQAYDEAEVQKSELERYYDIFVQAHVHFRTIAKGTFGG